MTIHPLADVQSKQIGEGTVIWQFAIILLNAVIGKNCNINCHTYIENDVIIGDRVTLKPGVFLWDGMVVEDDVFIGANVCFATDKYPRSRVYPENFQSVIIRQGASIGANATILGGIEIGEHAMIGAGSVVTRNVAPYSVVYGNPARVIDQAPKPVTLDKQVSPDD